MGDMLVTLDQLEGFEGNLRQKYDECEKRGKNKHEGDKKGGEKKHEGDEELSCFIVIDGDGDGDGDGVLMGDMMVTLDQLEGFEGNLREKYDECEKRGKNMREGDEKEGAKKNEGDEKAGEKRHEGGEDKEEDKGKGKDI